MITKLKPVYKDYLWGGQKLVKDFGKNFTGEILAESWELSCHSDGQCLISTGSFSGMTLFDYIKENPESIGTKCEKYETFPILIKFIDAKQSLSIQVHPDDDYAIKYEGDNGKNEMWYIVDATEDAFIYYGFNKEITKDEYRKHISENTLLDVLNKVNVKKGDCFFIKAGTVHAIGEGCLIAEVQQSSNVTYRVYDYARRDVNGNLRDLHIDKAIDVSTLAPPVNTVKNGKELVDNKYFTVEKMLINSEIDVAVDGSSFHSILVLDGKGVLECGEESVIFEKGDSLFVSADSKKYTISGNFEALLTHIKN